MIDDRQKVILGSAAAGAVIGLIYARPKKAIEWLSSVFVSIVISYTSTDFIVEYFSLGEKSLMIIAVTMGVVANDAVARVLQFVKTTDLPFKFGGSQNVNK